jgi:hypothetical protein
MAGLASPNKNHHQLKFQEANKTQLSRHKLKPWTQKEKKIDISQIIAECLAHLINFTFFAIAFLIRI